MPKIHGARAAVYLTDIGGTERNLSNFFDNVDFPHQADMAEASGFGDGYKTFLPGLKGASFNVAGKSGFGSNEPDAVLNALLGGGSAGTAKPAFVYGPDGSASGKVKYSGNIWVTNYNITQSLGDVVKFSSTWQIDGTPTRSTF